MRTLGMIWMWSNVISSILLAVYYLFHHNFGGDIHEAVYGLLFLWAIQFFSKRDRNRLV